MRKLVYILLLFSLSVGVNATSFRRDWFLLYNGGDSVDRQHNDSIIAYRANPGLAIGEMSPDMSIIKPINPDFKWLVYVSAEDNYVPRTGYPDTAEYHYLLTMADDSGWSREIFYSHYQDTTIVILGGDSVIMPAYAYAQTQQDSVDARCYIYYSDRSRVLKNYSNQHSREAHVAYLKYYLNQPSSGGYYHDGIFGDNGSYHLWNTGTLLKGGHIYEAGGLRVDSVGITPSDWWWQSNLKPFYQAVHDTFANAANWATDGKPKYYGPNIDGTWTYEYVDSGVADYLFPEYEYSTFRDHSGSLDTYSYDSAATINGVSICWMSTDDNSAAGFTVDYHEHVRGNVCLFYLTRYGLNDSAMFYQFGRSHPDASDWDSMNWCGAMDFNVGNCLDTKYSAVQTGTDPLGQAYTLYKRQYQNALILMRPRGNYGESIDTVATKITYNLGGNYQEILPEGDTGAVVTSTTFWNGQGKIMILSGGAPAPTTHKKHTGKIYIKKGKL